jgi:ACR3 family arsenite efflux pump ArsB
MMKMIIPLMIVISVVVAVLFKIKILDLVNQNSLKRKSNLILWSLAIMKFQVICKIRILDYQKVN